MSVIQRTTSLIMCIVQLVHVSVTMKTTINFKCIMLKDLSWECYCPQRNVVLTLGNNRGFFIVCDMEYRFHFMKTFAFGMMQGLGKRKRRNSGEETEKDSEYTSVLFVLQCTPNENFALDCVCPESNVVLMLRDSKDFFIVCDSRSDVVLMKSASYGKVKEPGQLINMFEEEEKNPSEIKSVIEGESKPSSREGDDLEMFEKEIEGSQLQSGKEEQQHKGKQYDVDGESSETHQAVASTSQVMNTKESGYVKQGIDSDIESIMQTSSQKHTSTFMPESTTELEKSKSTPVSPSRGHMGGTEVTTQTMKRTLDKIPETTTQLKTFVNISDPSQMSDVSKIDGESEDTTVQQVPEAYSATTETQSQFISKLTTLGKASEKSTTNLPVGAKDSTVRISEVNDDDVATLANEQLTTTSMYDRIAKLLSLNSDENEKSNNQSPDNLGGSDTQNINPSSTTTSSRQITTTRQTTPRRPTTTNKQLIITAKQLTTTTRHPTTTTTTTHSITASDTHPNTADGSSTNTGTEIANVHTTTVTTPSTTAEDSTRCFAFGRWLNIGETYGNKYLCHYECMPHGVMKRICNTIHIRG